MEPIGRYLRASNSEHQRSVGLVCPGCNETHYIAVWRDHPGPTWQWNGDGDLPVFTPSLLVRTSRYKDLGDGDAEYDRVHAQGFDAMVTHPVFGVRCHSFIGFNGAQPGYIQFLDDCTHDLKGKTVPLVDIAKWEAGRDERYAAALRAGAEANKPATKAAKPSWKAWR